MLSQGRKSAVFGGLQSEVSRGGDHRCEEILVMRTHMPALAMAALIGFCSQVNAQAECPELARLRGEAAEAVKQMPGGPVGRCQAYNRFSAAWDAIAQYANDHRESCDVSLSQIERRRHEAERARDNVCAGRPRHPFPPEIIRR